MATDERLNNALEDSDLVRAPPHAWRALGQLRAEAAIQPLLGLLRLTGEEDDDWVAMDLPKALGQIGPSAIAPVSAFLNDSTHRV